MIFIHSFSNKKKISFFAEKSTKLDKKFIFESATRIYMNQKFLSHVYNESASRDRFFWKKNSLHADANESPCVNVIYFQKWYMQYNEKWK